MQKITPFLWFDNNAEEAMKFYTSIFKNSKIGKVTRYSEGAGSRRNLHDWDVPDRGTGIRGVEWRPDLQIYRGDIVCGEL